MTAQALTRGRVLAVFQPHGYGPLGFMRDALLQVLGETLRVDDLFLFLPVYYAGGTSSFEPTAEAVADQYRDAGLPVTYAPSRDEARDCLLPQAAPQDTVLVMGARDPSLPAWTLELVRGGGTSSVLRA